GLMRAVNLIPKDLSGQRRSLTTENLPAVVGAGMGLLVTAILAMSMMHAHGKVSAAQAELNSVSQELAATPAPPQPKTPPNEPIVGEQAALVSAVQTE